jgi:hypothetical protein
MHATFKFRGKVCVLGFVLGKEGVPVVFGLGSSLACGKKERKKEVRVRVGRGLPAET